MSISILISVVTLVFLIDVEHETLLSNQLKVEFWRSRPSFKSLSCCTVIFLSKTLCKHPYALHGLLLIPGSVIRSAALARAHDMLLYSLWASCRMINGTLFSRGLQEKLSLECFWTNQNQKYVKMWSHCTSTYCICI